MVGAGAGVVDLDAIVNGDPVALFFGEEGGDDVNAPAAFIPSGEGVLLFNDAGADQEAEALDVAAAAHGIGAFVEGEFGFAAGLFLEGRSPHT